MSFDTALIVATFILVTTVFFGLVFISSRRRKAQEEELQRAASSRGWKFESVREHGYRIHRWTGTTEGVAWTAESLDMISGGKRRHRRRHIGRWRGAWSAGPNQPVLFMGMPKGAEVPAFSVAQGEGFLAQMAAKAAGYAFDLALDVYFGKAIGADVDATLMRRVNVDMPGFIVMASDVAEGERFLAEGFERAMVDASNGKTSLLADDDRPWVLMRRQDLTLARMEKLRTIEEIGAFIQAGVALTRVARFRASR
jgi:hypothetical protein